MKKQEYILPLKNGIKILLLAALVIFLKKCHLSEEEIEISVVVLLLKL